MFTLTSAKNVSSVYYPSREFYSCHEATGAHEIFLIKRRAERRGSSLLRLQTINISGLMKILLYDEYLPRFRLPAENYYIIKKDKNATTSARDIAARTAHAPIKLNISREIFRADVCVCVCIRVRSLVLINFF